MKQSNDLVVIMCPPLSDYPEAPKDQSHSELFDCPKCKEKMWLSEKKKGVLMFSSCLEKTILLGCYHCIKQTIERDPSLLIETQKVDL